MINPPDQKQPFNLFSLLPVLLLSALHIFGSFMQTPVDSDFSGISISANLILEGNPLLTGWHFTSSTFLLTEMPVYLIATKMFGYSPWSGIVAVALLTFLMVLISGVLMSQILPPLQMGWGMFLFFALSAFPPLKAMPAYRGHVAVFTLYFSCLICLNALCLDELKAQTRKLWFGILFFLLSMAGSGDLFILPVLIVPLCFLTLVRWIIDGRVPSKLLAALAVSLLGVATGKGIEILYLQVGGAHVNSQFGERLFSNFHDIPAFFWEHLQDWLRIYGSDFTGEALFSLNTLKMLLRALPMLFGIGLIVHTLKKIFQKKDIRFIESIIALGIAFNGLFLIIADFVSGSQGSRYIAYYPTALSILIVIEISRKGWLAVSGIRRWTLIGFACILILANFYVPKTARISTSQERLKTWLYENDLTDGYADFWDANMVTLSSRNQVRLRAITFRQENGDAG